MTGKDHKAAKRPEMTPPFSHPEKRVERMVFFSDAVFAIAITLLAMEVKLPDFKGAFTFDVLQTAWPRLIAYATSYAVIGISWWAHTRISQRLIDIDGKLLTLNLLRLFFIAIIPFPTSVLMEHGGNPDSWVFYSLTMAVSSSTEFMLWAYASQRPKLTGNLSPRERLAPQLKLALTPLAFAASALAAHLVTFNAGWIVLSILLAGVQPLVERIITKRLGVPADL